MSSMLLSPFSPRYPTMLTYMLQNTEYRILPYLQWYWRTQDFSRVMKRRQLVPTRAARMLLWALRIGMVLQIVAGLLLLYFWYKYGLLGSWAFAVAIIISYPLVWAHAVVVPLLLGRWFIAMPRDARQIVRAERIFREHTGAKIAVAGSYGKTSMKELLVTVLGAGKKVAATPANKNVSPSHALWAQTLADDEDILVIEYGEGAPGDVARFARRTHPTHAVITGIAAAHLDHYRSTEAAAKDIFTVASFIPNKSQVYVNGESGAARPFLQPGFNVYDRHGALGWEVGNVTFSIEGLNFTMKKGKQKLKLTSNLLGRHNIGPLSLAAALGKEFGLSDKQIAAGISQAKPFEHRMQPYRLSGAWIIDDTYNGNIEGIRAGAELLRELSAKRKVYVTPGLVDQGKETARVHEEMGRLIAASGADKVVLMKNSATGYIRKGLEAANFKGELQVEENPLEFYANLSHFVAAGDLVLLQNDWPDNYA